MFNTFVANYQRVLVFIISILMAFAISVQAADYQSHQLQNNQLTIVTSQGKVSISAVVEGALEVHYQHDNVKQLPSYSLLPAKTHFKTRVVERSETLQFIAPNIRAVIEKSPLRMAFYQNEKLLVEEEIGYFNFPSLMGFRFKLQAQEKLLGTGERVLGMDRRGHRLPLYNKAHYGYQTHSEQMNISLPAVMSSNKYMLLFDNPAKGWIDLGKTEKDILQFEAIGGRSSYVVFAGNSYPQLIDTYTQATGRQPLPPRWVFGNFASRFGYHTESEARGVITRFRELSIPVDSIIFDLFWFGKDIQGHMGNLDWDRQAFANPEQMIQDFKQQGVKTVLITEPFILTSSKNWLSSVRANALAKNLAGKPKIFNFYFGETGLVDVFSQSGQDWFWSKYQPLLDQGIAGWWGDLGEPEVHPHDTIHQAGTADEIHNAYGHQWAKMVYERTLAAKPNQRPFILMRSGFNGSQRYGMMPWTGDVSRSWGGLKPQPELTMQMGLLGLAYTHSDLGGFAGGETFDKEMYIRWLQYGVFQPLYRPHAQEAIAPEPVFHDPQTQDIIRGYINLRYKLLPYNYSLAYQNSMSGMPLMRPLFFQNEANSSLIAIKDSFMWGDAFLVSPVTEPGVTTQALYLPGGVWFDFWTDKKFTESGVHSVPVSLRTIPVMVKAGSFVPMLGQKAIQTTDDYNPKQLTVHYYADPSVAESSYQMFDDDGQTPNTIENKQYELIDFTAKQDGEGLILGIDPKGYQYTGKPEARSIRLAIHNPIPAKRILIDGTKTRVYQAGRDFEQALEGAYYDAKANILNVKVAWRYQPLRVFVSRY
ncbi:glycosyl hydrolase [Saccharobesus litoralis]|uniref:Glycosyl hydrolase n=1 Tax=Saccharobesus litoralis TaxID=2172099 RepID=A0A2S0VTF7_9ALTE|nr:TIM-barrel domain-containing protein [Saccharobesus litoralis]AWB67473.1 glycosyl hydrolase [Saccharobesus litoralis]